MKAKSATCVTVTLCLLWGLMWGLAMPGQGEACSNCGIRVACLIRACDGVSQCALYYKWTSGYGRWMDGTPRDYLLVPDDRCGRLWTWSAGGCNTLWGGCGGQLADGAGGC